jgi:hypothetical protein
MTEDNLIAALDDSVKVIKALADNEILKSITIVGDAIKVIELAADIRDRIFAAKMRKILSSIEKVSKKSKDKIRNKVLNNPEEGRKVGETLLLLIDRMSEMDKAEIIARVFIAYVDEYINFYEFKRLVDAIDHAFLDDLKNLLDMKDLIDLKKSEEPFMQYLARAGLTRPIGGETWEESGEIHYEITDIGEMLIGAYYNSNREMDTQP